MSIIVYFLFSAFMFFAGFSIFFQAEGKSYQNRYLGLAILFKSVIQISFILVVLFNQVPYLKTILKITTPLYFMVPPLAFFYFRNTLGNSNKKQRYDWIHFIPFMLVVAVLVFEFMGYKNAITFNETNMSFNEFFILQSISSKNLALIQPLFILAYLSFVYFKYLNKNLLRNSRSTSDNIRLLIVIWFVLFCTQIAKLMKLCFGDFFLNNIGDILFSFLNIFIIFLIYKLIGIISKVTENIISFKKFGKSISGK